MPVRRAERLPFGDAHEGDNAKGGGSEYRKHHLPRLGGHGVLQDAMGGVEACRHGRDDEHGSDEQTRTDRADDREQELAEGVSQAGGGKADNNAEPSGAGVISP
ncbi:hypothetical protein J2S75_001508 [Ancylobacter polymorphus]|uniref:Uncharacterized protein n=1 Tax=Ancylobacter polymorphus TaxID=223390 RepID=A0ABU0B9I3_9HYPH|nr:hypothetical protein [Ancylobacter polymorphus]